MHPFFKACFLIGYEHCENCFETLRNEGKRAEILMFSQTNGANTHKGAIFSLGVLCAAIALSMRRELRGIDAILDSCARIAKGVCEQDFSKAAEKGMTAGERMYFLHGFKGVRGEVEAGFPTVRYHGFPVFEKILSSGGSIDVAGSSALIAMMAFSEDSNVYSRCGFERAEELKRRCLELSENFLVPESEIRRLGRELVESNISPGGSADLLAVCLMLHFCKERIYA